MGGEAQKAKANHRWSELAESREGKLGTVAHACNSRYQEAEAGRV